MVDFSESIFGYSSIVVSYFHWGILVSDSLQPLRIHADPILVDTDAGLIWAINRVEVRRIIQLIKAAEAFH